MITPRSVQSSSGRKGVMAPGSLHVQRFLPRAPVVTAVNKTERVNKWMTGNRRGIEDLVKKYNSTPASGSGGSQSKSWEKWKSSKVKAPTKPEPPVRPPEPEDERFIKSYTDYSAMMGEIEDLCRKHPTLVER